MTGGRAARPVWREAAALALLVALVLAVAAAGAAVTRPAIPGWYASLDKPGFTPPNWVFAPVWTALYLMMAVAAWLVWRRPRRPDRTRALQLFGLQLALNLLWSVLFFGAQAVGAALIEIGLLLAAILATMRAFHRVARAAAWLLAPYLAWVAYAAALNATIWLLN